MTLREVTRTVIGLVENVSGCPVVVSEGQHDASCRLLADRAGDRGGTATRKAASGLRVQHGVRPAILTIFF